MKNPLLVPELREMLASHRQAELQEFCTVTPPEVAAEFIGALTVEEQREALQLLEAEARSAVFAYFELDGQVALLEGFAEDDAVELVAKMPDEQRTTFLEQLPAEQHVKLRERFRKAEVEEAKPLIAELEEAQATEKVEPADLSPEEVASEVPQHLETFRFVNGRVERTNRLERGCWANVIDPSKENLAFIAEHFKVPLDFLTAALDQDETARIESEDNATLFIVKVPYFDEKNVDVLYFTIPIGIVVVNGIIITVCQRQGSVLQDFAQSRVRNIGGGNRFILQILMRSMQLYLQHLKQLNNAANIIQKKLEQESRNKQLIKLFNIEKSLVYFTTSLKSNMLMLERLRRMRTFELDDYSEDLIEDIFTECKQAIEMANIYSDILSGMMDAFASVISNNLNIVMKLLTSITIIMTIPVLVTSMYGMNVKLPGQDHPYAFFVVLGASLLVCVAVVYFFMKKRWLEN